LKAKQFQYDLLLNSISRVLRKEDIKFSQLPKTFKVFSYRKQREIVIRLSIHNVISSG